MTKNELINAITSLKVDLKYLKKELQFRLDGNDIDGITEKHKNDKHKYAQLSGVFQASVMMDNDTFRRSIKSIEKMEECLKS